MNKARVHDELSTREVLTLLLGVGLAVVPGLPFLESDAPVFVRFHNWAIFVGGLVIGAVLAAARERWER